jgi:hypothetical protein
LSGQNRDTQAILALWSMYNLQRFHLFFHPFLDKTEIILPARTFHTLWNEFTTIASYRLTSVSKIKKAVKESIA